MKNLIDYIHTFNPELAHYLSDQERYVQFVDEYKEYLSYEIHLLMEECDAINSTDVISPIISNASAEFLEELIDVYGAIVRYCDDHHVDILQASYTLTSPQYFIELTNKFWQIQQSG